MCTAMSDYMVPGCGSGVWAPCNVHCTLVQCMMLFTWSPWVGQNKVNCHSVWNAEPCQIGNVLYIHTYMLYRQCVESIMPRHPLNP